MSSNVIPKYGLIASAVISILASFAFWASPARAESVEIVMGAGGLLQFEPAEVTISPGDTIIFSMGPVGPHNIVFDAKQIPGQDKRLAKKLSKPKLIYDVGESVEVTFPPKIKTGVYGYYCQPHRGAGMYGKVIVK